jgi:hypothetical protein
MLVVRLSALRTGRLHPPENIPGTHFCYRLSRPQCHSAAGRIKSMKNSNDTIGNRTRDLPACRTVQWIYARYIHSTTQLRVNEFSSFPEQTNPAYLNPAPLNISTPLLLPLKQRHDIVQHVSFIAVPSTAAVTGCAGLCDKATVLGETIKGTLCIILFLHLSPTVIKYSVEIIPL